MKALVISFSAILASLSTPDSFVSQAKITKIDNPPIVGLWRLQLDSKANNCTEDYNFKSNLSMSVVSADEWTYGKYELIYNEAPLPILVLHTEYDDNNVDCSGVQRDQTGERFAAYFRAIDDNTFDLCPSQNIKSCNMRFKRIMPY